jgi:hypothetical protein
VSGDHVARFIVNANHSIMRAAESPPSPPSPPSHRQTIPKLFCNAGQIFPKEQVNRKGIWIMKNRKILFTTLLLTLVCFWLAPRSLGQLPSPTPDGGYPGYNTAEGESALFSVHVATGIENTAIGYHALALNTTGSHNTAVGSTALHNNNGDFNTAIGTNALAVNLAGIENTATGFEALVFNEYGIANTATGFQALYSNVDGSQNTANGVLALFSNTSGAANTAIGIQALYSNTASNNTATGAVALYSNTTGTRNTATGTGALQNNLTANNNTADGSGALSLNSTGGNNTAVGLDALLRNNGSHNTADGVAALHENTTGGFNTANGYQALYFNQAGSNNTANGSNALLHNTGSNNIAVGSSAGMNLTTGNNNIDIGAPGVAAESAKIHIGKQGTQNGTFIAGIYGVAGTGSQVVVNSAGKLGVTASSARFKEHIKPMDKASEAVLRLKPITFRYKKEIDSDRTPQFGLVAEEVEKVNPDLVIRDPDGKPYTVRYEAVNAMLLNEFLKEHKKIEEQQATIVELKKAIARLAARDDQLAAQIQKVSAQIEVRNSAPQMVKNDMR